MALDEIYNKENGYYLIEIRLKKIKQLFNTLDPSPFLEKDLSERVANYIIDCAKEIGDEKKKIKIFLPEQKVNISLIKKAISNYFLYLKNMEEKTLKQKLKEGFDNLIVGFIFLSLTLILSSIINSFDNFLASVISEGLAISGWVAMWRPISIFLYEWRPIKENIKLYNELSKIDVEVVYE